ncbi:MAG TPA: hypothetical protein VH677_00485 [Nitrososphaera sp.]|jgi:hypothetical protein
MRRAILAVALAVPLLVAALSLRPAFAHNEAEVGDIRIIGGWENEPPLLGQFNAIYIQVERISDGSPVTNAFSSTDVNIVKGGESKALEVLPAEEAGVYLADIIPTQLGQYAITFQGTISGQQVNTQIEIEDVEDSRSLNFPESGDTGTGVPQGFVDEMRAVISDLTTQIDSANTAAEEARDAAQAAAEIKAEADRAYLVGIVGIGVGVAGIAIAAVALRKS